MITAPDIRVEVDKAKMARIERAVNGSQRVMGRIVYNALKRTSKKGRTLLDKEIRTILQIKKKSVTSRIVDAEKATHNNWRWRLGISGRRISLASFGSVSKGKKGVRYTIKRGLCKTALRAFLTEGFTHAKSGEYIESKSVWRRAMAGEKPFSKGTPTRAGNIVRRMPLIHLKGPSIGHVVKNSREILTKVHIEGQRDLNKEIDGQLKRELAKRVPK
jgi:hypothetical protein